MKVIGKNLAIFTDSTDRLAEISKFKSCCFSGHRTERLPREKDKLMKLEQVTRDTAAMLYHKGIDTFITGMARGFDLIAANAVAFDPEIGDKLRIVCVMPYAHHRREMKTPQEDMLYQKLQKRADIIVCLGDNYTKDCYKIRNQFMVNNSCCLIAYLKNEQSRRSGTGMTCNLAKNAGHNIYMITEKDL